MIEKQYRVKCSVTPIWHEYPYYPKPRIDMCKSHGCEVEIEVRTVEFVETVKEDWKPYHDK